MKCNNCGGTMRYDVASYGLVCDFCGSVKPLHRPEEEVVVGEQDFNSVARDTVTDWGTTRRLVTCKQCGAEMLYDSDQMSAMCPYCGSAIILTAGEMNSGIAPGGIIPFTTTREDVEKNYYKWNKFAFWSPESFRKGKVLGNLVGVYVPFWTFTADTFSTYKGNFGYTTEYNTGDGIRRDTKWYNRNGIVDKLINDVCIGGSRRFISNKKLNQVVNFRTDEILPYTPDALAGFAAEKYTIGIDEAWEMLKPTIRKKIEHAACVNERADCYNDLKISTEYGNIKFRYFLFPIWLAACKYKGKIYYVVASGHDNRGLCDRPVSAAKIVLIVLAILAILSIPMLFYIVMAIYSFIIQNSFLLG